MTGYAAHNRAISRARDAYEADPFALSRLDECEHIAWMHNLGALSDEQAQARRDEVEQW